MNSGEALRAKKKRRLGGAASLQGFENGSGKSRSREAGLLRGTRFQKREEGKERGKEKAYQLFSVSLVCSIGEGRLLGEPFGAAVTIA